MVKCVKCGLLAVRDEYDSSLICEATERLREKGDYQTSNGNPVVARSLLCYAQQRDFGNPRNRDDVLALINEEIDCGKFMSWCRGKTPMEHEEMELLQKVETLTRKHREEDLQRQRDWRDDDEKWRKQVESHSETRHQELRRDEQRRHDATFWLSVAALVISIIGMTVSAVVALATTSN